jgi:signal transduction histidine kinase
MNRIFKQLGESATSLKANNFKIAVVRLTALYTTGVFVILLVLTGLVYGLFSTKIDEIQEEQESHLSEDKGNLEEAQEPLIEKLSENLFDILIFSDTLLLFLTVFISYFLARMTLAPLEDTYQKQKRFIADAAHELRTPLAVLKAGEEVLLQQERTIEEYKRFTTESLDEVNRLIGLSNDLLHLAQQADLKQQHERVSLSNIVHRQCESMRLYAQTKHVELSLHLDEHVFILGRSNDLSRLILNLLKNAIDYNKQNGTVRVSLIEKDTKVVLTIEDTGIGISPKDIPHIFERFYKADSSRTQNASGSGLGLSIAREIVEEHKGSIYLESRLGAGTVCTVRFPSVQ